MVRRKNRKGTALLMSMIILALLSAWIVAVQSFSGSSVQLSNNQRKADGARACAESGLEIMRCWMSEVEIAGNTYANQKFVKLGKSLQDEADLMSSKPVTYDSNAITIPTVVLDSASGKNFSAVITPDNPYDPNKLLVEVTGTDGSISKSIRANYEFGKRGNNVFDFGVASKGPVSLHGNIELEGVNISVESNVYIESADSSLALSIIGSSSIAGDVSIVNPAAYVDLQGGHAEIGGESGQEAIDNHVRIGVPSCEFPTPDPTIFSDLVPLTPLPENYNSQNTFNNVIIPHDTNPSFAANMTFNGVLFIEVPNQVTFNGNVNITGVVVGNGDPEDNSRTNTITFSGSVTSTPVSALPEDPNFNPLRNQAGTFLMAPGFGVSFGGDFHTLNGAVAANGIDFYGNAGGTINGSVINYSPEPMTFDGNSDLYFNRSNASSNPPGFVSHIILKYDPSSYAEGPF